MSTQWLTDTSTSPGPWNAPGEWEYSGNAGASWTPYNGGAVGQIGGPAGTQRYRAQIVIPAGVTGSWSFTAQGDLWDANTSGDWFIYYDGSPVVAGFQYGSATAVLPAVPGSHTVEVWCSRAGAGGLTQLRAVSSAYPAVVVEPVPCGCCATDADVMCYSRDVAAEELLANGNFSASTGTGAASSIGPGWTQDAGYAPCGPNIFAAPCSAGSWSYFTTNGGAVTGGGANAAVPALGGRSMAVNVSSSPAAAFMRWNNVNLVNGQRYRFRCRAAVSSFPFAVALRIDDVRVAPLTSPAVQRVWTVTDAVFTWSGTTGTHSISVNSDSTVFGGNDHFFDDFSLTPFPDARAFMLLCDGVPTWFDVETGAELTEAERGTMRQCPTDATFVPVALEPHVRVMSISWGIPLAPAGDEENGAFSTAPTSMSGAVSTNSGYFHPPLPGSSPAPCDSGAMMEFDWAGAPVSSLEWTYRMDPNTDTGNISGNTYYWSAPGLGIANFDFGVHPLGELGLNQPIDSAVVNGYKARLTLLSVGNSTGGNRHQFDNTACGNGRMHAHPGGSGSDQPQTYRIEFFQQR